MMMMVVIVCIKYVGFGLYADKCFVCRDVITDRVSRVS